MGPYISFYLLEIHCSFRQCKSIGRSSEPEAESNIGEEKQSNTTHQSKENGYKTVEKNENMEDGGDTEMFSCLICGKEFK